MTRRVIDGKVYHGRGLQQTTKTHAKKTAKHFRTKEGKPSRVIKTRKGYTAFVYSYTKN